MSIKSINIPIEGMQCAACSANVEKHLQKQEGIQLVQVNLATRRATISYETEKITPAQMAHVIDEAGYHAATEKVVFPVKGMSCASCVSHVEKALRKVEGVISVQVNLATQQAQVEYFPTESGMTEFRQAVEDAGYEVPEDSSEEGEELPHQPDLDEIEGRKISRKFLFSAISAAVIMLIGFAVMFFHNSSRGWIWVMFLLATPVQFWAGGTFYKNGFGALKHRTANMNTLIAVGTSAAYFYSVAVILFPGFFENLGAHGVYFDTSSAIVALILLGRMLETRARGKTSEAIRRLMDLRPPKAHRIQDGKESEIPVSEVHRGDILLVKPGERIPLDGKLIKGHSGVDESMITGESIPVEKSTGDDLIGGTLNKLGSFEFEVTKIGKETALSQIIHLVEEAQGSKAPIQRFADQVAAVFVPAVMGTAAVTFIIWILFGPHPAFNYALLSFVSVLIIACPCALGLATPTAIMVGTGKGAEKGILIRSGDALETARKLQVIVLDKTGTLTQGEPNLQEIRILDSSILEEELLKLAASVENHSEHPLGEAIVRSAKEKNLTLETPDQFEAVPGQGVRAQVSSHEVILGNARMMESDGIILPSSFSEITSQGRTPLFAGIDGKLVGVLIVADSLKSDAAEVIHELKKLNLEVVMMTGDNPEVAKAIAKEVGIDRVLAGVLPKNKADEVKRLQQEGKIIAMVGDGINDAPALAQADVGIALGTGTDVAMESSDITLISGNLKGIASAISLSRATLRTIRQNLFWAVGYNVLLIPLAAGILYPFTGWLLNPMLAAAAMALSSVSVVTNSLRLKGFKG